MKKTVIIILGIAVLLICVGLSGCTETDDLSYVIYDDIEFASWISNSNEKISEAAIDMDDLLTNRSWYALEMYAVSDKDLIDNELKPECLAFNLSYENDELRNEYYEMLNDRSWSSFYVKMGAINMQNNNDSSATDNFHKAGNYTNMAVAHLKNVLDMMRDLTP